MKIRLWWAGYPLLAMVFFIENILYSGISADAVEKLNKQELLNGYYWIFIAAMIFVIAAFVFKKVQFKKIIRDIYEGTCEKYHFLAGIPICFILLLFSLAMFVSIDSSMSYANIIIQNNLGMAVRGHGALGLGTVVGIYGGIVCLIIDNVMNIVMKVRYSKITGEKKNETGE